jgi:hypothetical protein
VKDRQRSLIEWYKDLFPHQQFLVAGYTVATALGAILGYLIFFMLPDDLPVDPFPILASGLLFLYLAFRELPDEW